MKQINSDLDITVVVENAIGSSQFEFTTDYLSSIVNYAFYEAENNILVRNDILKLAEKIGRVILLKDIPISGIRTVSTSTPPQTIL